MSLFVSFVFLKHRCLCRASAIAVTSEAFLNLTPSPPTWPQLQRDFWPLSQKLTFCCFPQFVCHWVNLQTAGVPALSWPPMAPHQVNSWPELCPRCEGSQESAPDMLYRPLRRGPRAYLLISAARICCTHGTTSAAKRAVQMQQRCKKSSWEQPKSLPIRDLLDQTWTFFSLRHPFDGPADLLMLRRRSSPPDLAFQYFNRQSPRWHTAAAHATPTSAQRVPCSAEKQIEWEPALMQSPLFN